MTVVSRKDLATHCPEPHRDSVWTVAHTAPIRRLHMALQLVAVRVPKACDVAAGLPLPGEEGRPIVVERCVLEHRADLVFHDTLEVHRPKQGRQSTRPTQWLGHNLIAHGAAGWIKNCRCV